MGLCITKNTKVVIKIVFADISDKYIWSLFRLNYRDMKSDSLKKKVEQQRFPQFVVGYHNIVIVSSSFHITSFIVSLLLPLLGRLQKMS